MTLKREKSLFFYSKFIQKIILKLHGLSFARERETAISSAAYTRPQLFCNPRLSRNMRCNIKSTLAMRMSVADGA
jgi:hypothetical protein